MGGPWMASVDETRSCRGKKPAQEGPMANGGFCREPGYRSACRHQQWNVDHGLVIGNDQCASGSKALQRFWVPLDGPRPGDALKARNPPVVNGALNGVLVGACVVHQSPAGAAHRECCGAQSPYRSAQPLEPGQGVPICAKSEGPKMRGDWSIVLRFRPPMA